MKDPLADWTKTFSVDFSTSSGTIRPMHGINLGPSLFNGVFDASEYFRHLRIPSVRLHDCPWAIPNVVDIHNIFPLMHADPADPRNYVFAPTDDYLLSVKNAGADIKYRLGESAEMYPRRFFLRELDDFETWAEVALHVVMHYNDGWAGGFRHGIKYWEVWNEPWTYGPKGFWPGTPESFFRLYEIVAKKLKAHDPSLKVGAGLCGGAWPLSDEGYANKFLQHCRKTNTPFDYHAWHQYGPHPAYVARHARIVRAAMDRHGFEHSELHMDEWAPHFQQDFAYLLNMQVHAPVQFPRMQGIEGGTLVATVLCWLQDLPVDVANYYWAAQDIWGLLDHWFRPTKIYDAFSAFAELYKLGNRVQASGSDEPTGQGILAAVDEGRRSGAILISRFEGWQCEMELSIDGMPEPVSTVEFYQLGDGRYPTPVRQERITGSSVTLRHNMAPPDALLLKLRFGDQL